MASSSDLKAIYTEAYPLIEQQLDLADLIAGLREKATAIGLDWSQIKALLKAQIQDERDETGGRKRVRKIIDKAEHASAYADMLGLANMNEKYFSSAGVREFAKAEIAGETVMGVRLPAHNPFTGELQDEPETERNEPEAAAEVAGDYLREPVAAGQGQIIREGDAPRETDRDYSGDASRPDTELQMDRATEGSFETRSEAAEKGREAIPAGPEGADLSHAGAGESPATNHQSVSPSSPDGSASTESAAGKVSGPAQPSPPKQAEPIKAGEGVPPLSPANLSDEEVVPAFMKGKPGCLKLRDGHCKIGFATEALCAECADKRARAMA